jgi:parvulin-like peptidyl-prolyl isomerase
MKLSFGWIGIGIGVAIAGASVGMVKLRNEKPVAVVNGEKITRASFIAAMEKDQGAGILRRLIQEKLVLQEARKKGLLPTHAQVQAEIAQMKETEPDLDRQLRLRGKSMDELSTDVRGRLAMANLIAADVKLPDADVKKIWASHQKQFNRPEGRKIAMVVTKTADLGEKARSQLKAGVQADLAAQNAGMALPAGRSQLSVFRGQLPASVEKSVFSLKAGDVSEVLPMGKAFAVVKILEVIPAHQKSYDEVKDRLLLAAKLGKGKNQIELLQGLQKQAKIDVQSPRYKGIIENSFLAEDPREAQVARSK